MSITDASLQAAEQNQSDVSGPQPPVQINLLTASGPDAGYTIQKVFLDSGDPNRFVEIRPPLRRLPDEVTVSVEMVDANMAPCAIQTSDGYVIQSLILSPNPDNVNVSSSKIINRYNTMTRWVELHWGDEMDMVNISGSSFSFTAFTPEDTPPGLSVVNRNDTNSYLMLKELVKFYRINGALYQDSSTYIQNTDDITQNPDKYEPQTRFLSANPKFVQHHPREGLIRERLYIQLTFDYVTFYGYFESFDLVEETSMPYRFTYSAVFKAEKTKYLLG